MHCRKSPALPRIHVIWLLAGVLAISLTCVIYSQLVAQDPGPQYTPSGGAPTQPQDTASDGTGGATFQPAEPSVREILNQRIDVNFQEATLADALQYLRDALNVQIVAKNAPLNATGISLDAPITLDLKAVRASLALELVLGAANQDQLTYYTRDNLIIITSKDDLANTLTTRIYDVRAFTPEASGEGSIGGSGSSGGVGMRSMMGGMRSGMGAGMSSGMSSRAMMSGGMGSSAQQMERPTSDNPLTEIIESVIEPQSWEVSGGPGAIRWFNGLLIVRQSDAVHAQIEDLLAEIQSAYATQQP
jgi:type II secretory pathway component GspD/PulD (secretin)